ncbi:hypothetical protein SLA2020_367820 [Shorea laevis]
MLIFIGFRKLISNIVTIIFSVSLVIFSTRICILFCRNYDDGTVLRFVLLTSFEVFSLSAFFDFSVFFNGNHYLIHRNQYWVNVGVAIVVGILGLRWFNWAGWDATAASTFQNSIGRL